MADTSEQFGIEYNLSHLLDVLRGFQQIGDAAERSGKRVDKALSGSRSRLRGNIRQNAPALLDNANVNVSPQGAPVTTTARANRLSIMIKLMNYSGGNVRNGARAASSVAERINESGYVGKRSKYLPALIKEPKVKPGSFISGPRQRLVSLMESANRALGVGNVDAYEDAMEGVNKLNDRLSPKTPKALKQKRPWLPTGPRQQQAKLWDAMHYALSTNQFAAFDDAQEAYGRLHRKLNPQRPSAGQAIKSAFMSSRFGADGIMPLVGKTMQALNAVSPGLGEVGLALEAISHVVGPVIQGFKGVIDVATEAGSSFAKVSALIGSGSGTTTRLMTVGASLGLNANDMGGLAGNLHSSITGDPMGRMAGMMLGVYNIGGVFGQQDRGSQLETALRNLKKMGPGSQQTALARELGLDSTLSTINNKHLGRFAGRDAQVQQDVMSPDMIDKSQRFQEAMGRLSQAFQNLLSALSPAVLDRLTSMINGLANLINLLADFLSKHEGMLNTLVSISPLGIAGKVGDMANNLFGGSSNDGITRALNDNTRTTRENTQAMLAPGVYGSGNASRGPAIGEGMSGMAWRQAQDAGGFAQSTY